MGPRWKNSPLAKEFFSRGGGTRAGLKRKEQEVCELCGGIGLSALRGRRDRSCFGRLLPPASVEKGGKKIRTLGEAGAKETSWHEKAAGKTPTLRATGAGRGGAGPPSGAPGPCSDPLPRPRPTLGSPVPKDKSIAPVCPLRTWTYL